MKLAWVILFLDAASAILIGSLKNCTYAAPDVVPFRFNASSCESCVCDALRLYSSSFLALNCFGNGAQCELFFNYSHSFNMMDNEDAMFLFYPDLPRIVGPTG